jgi:ADP-ribose pyrophosphatase YjhB (NUDIX family)
MAERLFQVGIKALITDSDGRILLLQSQAKDGTERWDLPGGRMDENESFMQTLSRELIEEIGTSYEGEPVFLMTVLSHASIQVGSGHVGLILNIYRTTIPVDAEIQLNDYETGSEWVAPTEAGQRLQNKYPADFLELITG